MSSVDIREFGIHDGISEVIVTTMSKDGVPNAAPMGLHQKDGRLYLRLFNSKTLDNILEKPLATANIVDDPVLFVRSALSDIGHEGIEFVEGFPVLKGALAWIRFECKVRKGEDISVVELSPVSGAVNSRTVKPINRGFNAVIEASVDATRYVIFREKKYLERIGYYDKLVRKCGGAQEKEAMQLLYELIGE
ncbi:MAG: DUF447 family protein [Candidatus Methanoperedens sp.]|nr:DUF447 family protein [Candidatus Methanoperedens sp.]PKL53251.1 MAG: DUF447 domain-containing protein [Candidatus Methanoperedenaceae archaeon HGW-Methanoperedenaceae-1]